MHTYSRVGLPKNIATMIRWIKLLRLKCLRCLWTGKTKVNNFWLSGPIMPHVIKEAMQHRDGLVIERWT